MLTIICLVLFLSVFASMIKLAFRATWGLTKIIFGIVILPGLLLSLIFSGGFLLAVPILVILGIVTLGKLIVKA